MRFNKKELLIIIIIIVFILLNIMLYAGCQSCSQRKEDEAADAYSDNIISSSDDMQAELSSDELSALLSDGTTLYDILKDPNNALLSSKTTNTVHGEIISIDNAVNSQPQALTLYGKTALLGEPSIVSPAALISAGENEGVKISVHNRNLLQWPYYRYERSGATYKTNGVTYKANGDGSISFSGTNNGSSSADSQYTIIPNEQLLLPAGEYTLSTGVPEDSSKSWYLMASIQGQSSDSAVYAYGGSKKLVVTEPGYVFVSLRVIDGKKVNSATIYPQLEIGSLPTDYIKPDVQTLANRTPDGLRGIPVAEGGNYKDEDGQQWICDKIDFKRGKYVQRIGLITLDGSAVMNEIITEKGYRQFYISLSSIGAAEGSGTKSPILCNYAPYDRSSYSCAFVDNDGHFILRPAADMQEMTVDELTSMLSETPLHAAYILASPVEIDLTAEEIAAYKALQLNTPSTVITSSESFGKSLTYIEDSTSVSTKLLNGMTPEEMHGYREDSLNCLASYLVYQAGSTCVVGTPQTDENIQMFFPKYNTKKGFENLFLENRKFVFDDTTKFKGKKYPVFYGDCETFVSLLTKCIKYEDSAYQYAFDCEKNKKKADNDILLSKSKESGDYFDKPYTFDYRNLYSRSVDKTAYATDKMGNTLYPLCKIYDGNAIWDESVFETMETGDIIYCGYVENKGRYRNIGHIMYFIKNLDDLNKYGTQYGVTFQPIIENEESMNGKHGYLAEIGSAIDGKDVIRIRSIEGTIKAHSSGGTASNIIYEAMYLQKPQSNIFTSTKAYEFTEKLIG